jgi:hypothetical protein
MKTTLFATVAILGLATGGAAITERAQVSLQQFAVSAQPQTDVLGRQLAASGKPQPRTDERSMQLAGGCYPGATQHAANGQPQPQTDAHATQLAQGWHPSSDGCRASQQYAASGLPQADTSRPSSV